MTVIRFDDAQWAWNHLLNENISTRVAHVPRRNMLLRLLYQNFCLMFSSPPLQKNNSTFRLAGEILRHYYSLPFITGRTRCNMA